MQTAYGYSTYNTITEKRRRKLSATCDRNPIRQAQQWYTRNLPRTTVNVAGGTLTQTPSGANRQHGVKTYGPDFGGIPGLSMIAQSVSRGGSSNVTNWGGNGFHLINFRLSRPVALYSLALQDFDCTHLANGGCQNGCNGTNNNLTGETAYNVWPPVRSLVNDGNAGDLVTPKNFPNSNPNGKFQNLEHWLYGTDSASSRASKTSRPGIRGFFLKQNSCNGNASLQFGGVWVQGFQYEMSLPAGLGAGLAVMQFGAENPRTPCVPVRTKNSPSWQWIDARTGTPLTPGEIATISDSETP